MFKPLLPPLSGRTHAAPGLLRLRRLLPLLLALLPLLFPTGAAAAEITVGAPFALSGPVAEQAQAMRQAAELAAQQVNQQGGVLGDSYRLIFADTACDADKGVDVVRPLIQAGVLALWGRCARA